MVGIPVAFSVRLGDTGVEHFGSMICADRCSINQAGSLDVIFPFGFVYNGTGYDQVFEDDTFNPWDGLWMATSENGVGDLNWKSPFPMN